MTPVICARGVGHVFGDGPTAFRALEAVDADLAAGEVLLLMGPSGSGKTTLLQVLGALLTPTEGSVTVAGREVVGLAERSRGAFRLATYGFVFQAYNLFPMLTATENVMVALDLLGLPRAAARNRARELLARVGLAQRADAHPDKLSGGQRQRVAIARALAADPPILLADEPTAALDAESGLRVMELFRELADREGRALVIVTHDPRILHLGDRILRIADGRIAAPAGEAPPATPVAH
jgi:putative ABC transport system ATP-binding protein